MTVAEHDDAASARPHFDASSIYSTRAHTCRALVLFAGFRFALFFVRGNVPLVAFGLKNGQWTALAILMVAVPLLMVRLRRGTAMRAAA